MMLTCRSCRLRARARARKRQGKRERQFYNKASTNNLLTSYDNLN